MHLSKGLLGFVDVRSSISKTVVNASANAVLVECVCDSTRQEAKGRLGDSESLSDLVAFVGEDGKIQSKLFGELLLGFGSLSTDPNYFSLKFLSDVLDLFVESLGLGAKLFCKKEVT